MILISIVYTSLCLDEISAPTDVYGVSNILDPEKENSSEHFVYYQWNHSDIQKVLQFNTEIVLNNEITIHSRQLPGRFTNSTCKLSPFRRDGEYNISVTATDRCGQKATKSNIIEIGM